MTEGRGAREQKNRIKLEIYHSHHAMSMLGYVTLSNRMAIIRQSFSSATKG